MQSSSLWAEHSEYCQHHSVPKMCTDYNISFWWLFLSVVKLSQSLMFYSGGCFYPLWNYHRLYHFIFWLFLFVGLCHLSCLDNVCLFVFFSCFNTNVSIRGNMSLELPWVCVHVCVFSFLFVCLFISVFHCFCLFICLFISLFSCFNINVSIRGNMSLELPRVCCVWKAFIFPRDISLCTW